MKLRKNKKQTIIAPDFNDIRLSRSLSKWFIIQTLLLVGLSVFSVAAIQPIAKYIRHDDIFDWSRFFIVVAIWVVVVGIFEILQYRLVKKHLEKISDMIELLASGNYGAKIKVTRFDVFKKLAKDLNLLSEDLKQVQMFRDDFVNSYSHEFKTPIASINGFAQLLLTDETLDEKTRKKYLQIIADESNRLTGLASNTILLTRLDTQKIITDKKEYSLDEQLRRCVIMFSNDWMAKNIEFSGDGISEITYFGDEDLMQHIWINLIHNAIKFTPENGKISVSSKVQNNRIFVTISDTGIGMTPENAQRIFDKYYTENRNSTSKGLGLGLSIAHKIVKLCGGKITVESKLGECSTFTVELPRT
ncbi:MAG: HAMP domain-containing histidine kinase [Clostridia bacterium]|nr:HAMP domain-containing histidine kinase [Clostridia bacterium]